MTDQSAKSPSKSRASSSAGGGGVNAPARRISFASLDLQALERDLNASSAGRRTPAPAGAGAGASASATQAPTAAAATAAVKPASTRAGKPSAPARPRASASVGKAVKAEKARSAPDAPPPAAEVSEATTTAAEAASPEETPDPLEVVARQARLLLRLSAATEGLEARYRELAERRRADDALLEEAREEARQARQQARRLALENVRLMDALDWVYEALAHRGDPLAAQVASARRDCLRHLAAAGITEVPADGLMDGRLHEGLESVAGGEVPRYHIVSVVRRGYQMGADVLRRTEVTTAE